MASCAGTWATCFGDGRIRSSVESQERHLLADQVHTLIAVPPEYAVSAAAVGFQGEARDPSGPGVWGAEAQLASNIPGPPGTIPRGADRGGQLQGHSSAVLVI